MERMRFLNFHRFVAPDRGGRTWLTLLLAGGLGVAVPGCVPKSADSPTEDSLTSGRITIVCAAEAGPLLARVRDEFEALYPAARIRLETGPSDRAVDSLFAARAQLAAITRELSPEERAAALRGRLAIEGFRFARDAVVVVVHPENPVENLSLEDLRGIYRGSVRRWSALGGRDAAIVPVVQPPDADVTRFVVQEVMGEEPMEARARYADSDSAVVAAVAADPAAIGFVSLAWADRGARALKLAPIKGLGYVKPDPEAIYRGEYPLTRFFNFYVRSDGPPLANGFITFVTSRDGQRLVHEAGLVPTTVPVRFVRRSPMLGSH
jgi:phosphate transport system substrate-binding protein